MGINEYSVAIIAGGKSKRFGSSKLKAVLDGQTFLERSIDLAYSLSDKLLLIANERCDYVEPNILCYRDIDLGKGPLGGLYTALVNCHTPWMAAMPVDMPYLNKEIYHHLYHFCTKDIPVVAESYAGLEPLVSFWPQSVIPVLEECLKENELGLYRCLEKLGAKRVDCSEKNTNFNNKIFVNINRPEDLKK